MNNKKSNLIFILLIALIGFILVTVYFSITTVNKIQQQKITPLISVMNNNLGVKSKLLVLEIDLLDYLSEPNSRNFRYLKKRTTIMVASINNDLASKKTKDLHQLYGNPDELTAFLSQLFGLKVLIQQLKSEPNLNKTVRKNLKLLTKDWSFYSQQVTQNIEKQHSEILNELGAKYEQQFKYQLLIGSGSVLAIIIVLYVYLGQLNLVKKLKRAKLAAEESSQAKSRFLANMSHEIRTPLNGIIGVSAMAKKASHNPETSALLDKVILSSHCLLKIINDILDFSKIEANKLTIESIEYDLIELIETHSATVYASSKEKGLSLSIFSPAKVTDKLTGDPLRLLQVLNNLASNAIKFTDHGAVELYIEFNEKQLILRYCDHGIGMSENQLSTVFEDFNQADNSISRRFGGTGLGLNICKNLVELMQGELTVNSVLNQGSEFIVTLPLYKEIQFDQSIPVAKNLKVVSQISDEISSDLLNLGFNLSGDHYDYLLFIQQQNDEKVLEKLSKLQSYYHCPVIAFVERELIEPCQGQIIALEKPYRSYLLMDAVSQPKTTPVAKIKKAEQPNSQLQHQLILLVEDVEMNQLVAQTILEEHGAQVVIAEHGQASLELLNHKVFDLILMDIQMPVMDGISATKAIRKQHLADKTPIIALTANVFKEDIDHYADIGMIAHIPKPFDEDEMINTITKALGKTD